jgi:hypothetical protein
MLPIALFPGCDGSHAPPSPGQAELTGNRIKWENHSPASYVYEFNWSCYCVDGFTDRVWITVEEGSITKVINSTTGQRLPVELRARYRTIDGLFDFIQGAVDEDVDQMDAAYNSRFGYPVSCQVDYDRGVADEEMAFYVHEFVAGSD